MPEIQNAIKKGVKFSGATDLFFQNARKIGCKIIGITGTKGKGTISTLLYKILRNAGKDVFLAGNIGKPALDILAKLKKNSIVILEMSSFQLQDLQHSPDIAVVLNVFEDHLDSHKNFKEYISAKAQIAKFQKPNSKIFYDASNKWSKWIAQKSPAQKFPINPLFSNSAELENKVKSVVKIPGEHNLKNAVITATVAKSLGIPENIILKTVKNYRGMEHRLELVHSNILKNVGMNFFNDSASTNPYTAAAAIRAFPNQPKILICGGKDKNLDYAPLAQALKNSKTKMVILFGENKKKINKAINNQKLAIRKVENLQQAVQLAYKTAKQLQQLKQYNNTNIIFSPAAASFDMFKDYKDRGEQFKKIVKKLK
ncbi:MAG: UDP-N-acetylmuramoyl-L-alanine--D-glutamate ligase [Patescibacteria group bacterium]|nr:UDP-N-acetylmuramoyl-L-alanine--D-glutamate ligase [Patescibacteria group bacterium]